MSKKLLLYLAINSKQAYTVKEYIHLIVFFEDTINNECEENWNDD